MNRKIQIEKSGVQRLVGMSADQMKLLTDKYMVKSLDDLSLLGKDDFALILGTKPETFMVRKKLEAVALFLRRGGKLTFFTSIKYMNAWGIHGRNCHRKTPWESLGPAQPSLPEEGHQDQEGHDSLDKSSPTLNESEFSEKEHDTMRGNSFDTPTDKSSEGKFLYFLYEDDEEKGVQKQWQVPKDFVLPKCNRWIGWKFWLMGMPNFRVLTADGGSRVQPICPFRLFELQRLPMKIRRQFERGWKPTFMTMEKDLNLPDDLSEYNEGQINLTYRAGTENLRQRAEYIFLTRPKHCVWSVATWSKGIRHSEILKHGTVRDKANLLIDDYPLKKKRKRNEDSDSATQGPSWQSCA